MNRRHVPKGAVLQTLVFPQAEYRRITQELHHLQRRYPNASIRRWYRTIRADRVSIPVTIIIVRERLPKTPPAAPAEQEQQQS